MEILKGRPLAFISLVSIILMFISSKTDSMAVCIGMTLVFALIGVIISVLYYARKKDSLGYRIICIVLFLVISMTLSLRAFNFYSVRMGSIDDFLGQEITYTGEVLEKGYTSEFSEKHYVKITSANGIDTSINVVLEVEGEAFLSEGDIFSLPATMDVFNKEEEYLIADGIVAKIICTEPENVEIIGEVEDSVTFKLRRINIAIQDRIYSLINEKSGALVGAVTLGNKALLDNEIIRDFRRCGISHVLALSGMHITIIVGFFDFILQKLYLDRRIRVFVLAALGLAYLAITGFSMSASRAVIMLCIVYFAHITWEDSDSITSLALATVIILSINPFALTSISLWMSVFATLGIIVISEIVSPLGYKIKKKPLIVQLGYNFLMSVSITLAAIFFVSIFNWVCFGEISVISPVTNLIITPLVIITLILSLSMLLLSTFIHPLAELLGEAVDFLCSLIFDLSGYFSSLRDITVSLKYDFVKYIAIPFVMLLVVFLIVKIKHKWTIAILPTAVVAAFVICLNIHMTSNQGVTVATYLQDTSSEMLVVTNNESATVCDISTGGYRHLASAIEAAEAFGATEIENVVLTHYHNYHPSALLRVSRKYTVRRILVPEPEDEDERDVYNTICTAFRNSNTEVVVYRRGYALEVGEGCDMTVSRTIYIKRSKHPMFMISLKTEMRSMQNDLLYFSSPIFEDQYADYPSLPDYVIVGMHGPTIRQAPSLDLIESAKPDILFLADGEAMLSDDDTIESLEVLRDVFNTNIVFNKQTYEFILK